MTRARQYRIALPRLSVILILFFCMTAAVNAELPREFSDGWHSWTVPAVDDAPHWCCFEYDGKTARPRPCRLGANGGSYIDHRSGTSSPTHMNIYAQFRAGRITDVQALAADCPVRAPLPVADHEAADAAASVALLERVVSPRDDASSAALAAIAVHAGKEARMTLLQTARGNGELENRKDAVFWIGQLRARELSGELRELMFEDADPALREHAAFSWSQTGLPYRGAALIELGRTDRNPDVRGRAWFWLAQTADKDAEVALTRALRDEKSPRVRHDVIFALSQLPDDRGIDALIGVIENTGLQQADRKQALFWMGQSESARALDYLSDVLGH